MKYQEDIEKRRTFGIISHPDAGKTTLVEKLVPELKRKDYRVGTIKNSHHVLNFDKKHLSLFF